MNKSHKDDAMDLIRYRTDKLAMDIANAIQKGTPISIVIAALSQVVGSTIAYQCGGNLGKTLEELWKFKQKADDAAKIACRTLNVKGIPS